MCCLDCGFSDENVRVFVQAKNVMHQRLQQCEASKNSYAAELQKANDAQREYYTTLLPNIIQVYISS